jgi:hypothetical protein
MPINLPPEIQNLFRNPVHRNIIIGVGIAALLPVVVPTLVRTGRPLIRSAVKSGVLLLEASREAVAEAGETFEDIVAEVKAELSFRHDNAAAAAAAAVSEAESGTEA